jgi:hypothetical protein
MEGTLRDFLRKLFYVVQEMIAREAVGEARGGGA